MKRSNKVLLAVIVLMAAGLAVLWYFWDKVDEGKGGNQQSQSTIVNNFDECLAANYQITESYPRQCQTPDGRTFIEDIGNEQDKMDLIRISTPRPNDYVQSPLKISGEARGFWFSEASFPVRIYDSSGKELGVAVASAKSDNWMTEDFVPFEATLEFNSPSSGKGTLVLERDNPSGNKDNDNSLKVPVKFGQGAQTQQISLFYYNPSNDKDSTGNLKCSKDGLVAVKRNVTKSDNIIGDTIKLLLEGKLTQIEKDQGITTEYPLTGVEMESSKLDPNGVLTLTFKDPQNKTSGGSCRAGVLWGQIEATAMQFPGVKSVKFMPEALFQP